MKILFGIIIVVIILVLLVWIGLKIKPRPFEALPGQAVDLETIPLPDGLPTPVERFYRTVYGNEVPVIESAVVTGRAHMRISGITFPARFRFSHITGQDYCHYIETTIFGQPVFKVNESYINGRSVMELPFGTIEDDPKVNQGANLGLWAETLWFPSVFLTDARVRWESMDEATALLFVPFGDEEQTFVVRFDPETYLVQYLEAMRFKGAESDTKILWIDEAIHWSMLGGNLTATTASATWFDEGTPWAVFEVEEIVYNQDLGEYILQKGE